jgi:hypothetical protein
LENYRASTLRSLSKICHKENRIDPNQAVLTPAGDFIVVFGEVGYGEPIRILRVDEQALRAVPALSVSTGSNPELGGQCRHAAVGTGEARHAMGVRTQANRRESSQEASLPSVLRSLRQEKPPTLTRRLRLGDVK